jgi:hypothetical protein
MLILPNMDIREALWRATFTANAGRSPLLRGSYRLKQETDDAVRRGRE